LFLALWRSLFVALVTGWLRIVACIAAFGCTRADAHVVYDRRTVRQWSQEAALIVVAQFRSGMQVWRAPDGSDAQEFFTVRVLERLRGQVADDLDFFAHAEGEPRWRPGDIAVLFLERTGAHAGLARVAERFHYFSVQGAGHEWTLTPATRDEVVGVVRYWTSAPQPIPADAMRAAVLRELTDADARLQADALAELAHAGCQPALFPDPTTVQPFANLLTADVLGAPSRIALARALDGCPGFDAAAALRKLTELPLAPRERTALIRAAGMTDDPTLSAWLAALLTDPDLMVRREAAAALGHPRHAASVRALAAAAASSSAADALAAVRALAAIGTPEARAALTALTATAPPAIANSARAYLKQPPP
jgi:hypothetical protein